MSEKIGCSEFVMGSKGELIGYCNGKDIICNECLRKESNQGEKEK